MYVIDMRFEVGVDDSCWGLLLFVEQANWTDHEGFADSAMQLWRDSRGQSHTSKYCQFPGSSRVDNSFDISLLIFVVPSVVCVLSCDCIPCYRWV